MGFRLPKKSKTYFRHITRSGKKQADYKLNLFFDQYYLCLLVGFVQARLGSDSDLETTDLVDSYPAEYLNCSDYIAALLISTEIKRCLGTDPYDSHDVESLMETLIDARSPTRLTREGEKLLNRYAARGMDVIIEKMVGPFHSLEDFYEDYFDCFQTGRFLLN